MVKPPEIETEEEFKEFDPFFVGKGSAAMIGKLSPKKSLMWQFSGVEDVKSLKAGEQPTKTLIVSNDIDKFITNKKDLKPSEYQPLFYDTKKRTYEIFNFLPLKAKSFGDTPIREKDLILSEEDTYLIDFLKRTVTDYYAITSIAELMAFKEMGIDQVVFRQLDNCPMCKSYDGASFDVADVLGKLGSGESIVHPYCDCQFFPQIFREEYVGILAENLNEAERVSGAILKNIPVEFLGELMALSSSIDSCIKVIEFGNILPKYAELGVKDSEGVVVVGKADILYVHNSWVGCYGPVDFLEAYLNGGSVTTRVSKGKLEGAEEFFIKGRKAVRWNGLFWDPETGEEVGEMSFKKTGEAKKSGEIQEVKAEDKSKKKEKVKGKNPDQK